MSTENDILKKLKSKIQLEMLGSRDTVIVLNRLGTKLSTGLWITLWMSFHNLSTPVNKSVDKFSLKLLNP